MSRRGLEIRYFVADPSPHTLLSLLEGLVQTNVNWLRTQREAPGIYESGVKYIREGLPELWYDAPSMMRRTPEPGEDCDGLSCWRAGELRHEGYDAHAVLRLYRRPTGSAVYHALTEVRLPGGWVYDDPSARLGMLGNRPRVAGISYAPPIPIRYFKTGGIGIVPPRRPKQGKILVRSGGRPIGDADVPEAAPDKPETMRLITMFRTGGTWENRPRDASTARRTTVLVGDLPPDPYVRVEGNLGNIYYLPALEVRRDEDQP